MFRLIGTPGNGFDRPNFGCLTACLGSAIV